jgi:hypothetical protein
LLCSSDSTSPPYTSPRPSSLHLITHSPSRPVSPASLPLRIHPLQPPTS